MEYQDNKIEYEDWIISLKDLYEKNIENYKNRGYQT